MEQTKAELRKQYKQKRRALTPEQVTAASAQIRKRFMNSDGYKDCNHLLIYVSQDNEVDTIEIIEQALTDDKIVAVPKVYGDHMHFHRIHGMSDLKVGAYGILEPVGCDMLHPTEGILIVPGIVFDKNGHRIGYGGGYYDRYMKLHPELTAVAFAYDYQVLPEISCESFDERPDQLLTPSEIYSFMEKNIG
ncbi:MAG: 5-formyltetrahydrofolate cyclo-ligase [Coprococcus sp.]|nr:5-formyltetrahydrofolate cyclo-ligase [Clostridium sp. AF15-41]MED9989227.1 5-formyltetrahydrofolate cyclo-ligase [Coprococcus sp.]UEA75867.1 5-formyltetrahydrofolate cyclo-ligase [Lachnospiraceae bacterium GAM79]